MHVKLLSYSSCLTLDLKETKFKSDGSNVLFVWSGGGEAQGKESEPAWGGAPWEPTSLGGPKLLRLRLRRDR